MLSTLSDYGVPAAVALLMLISGTELRAAHIAIAIRNARALIAGTIGQLVVLPLFAFVLNAIVVSAPIVSTGTLLLALSPGGGISNYYCYLARRSVSLSASITAVGTLLSLLTIPTWMLLAPTISDVAPAISVVPAKTILSQLFALMVLPMAAGMILRSVLPAQIEHHSKLLRLISLSFALFILFLVIWSTQQTLAELAIPVLIGATLFIIGGMTCGWVLSYGLAEEDRSVLIIESGVRNIGVALLLGRTILNTEQFGQLATFLAAYFAVEIVIMLAFAHYLASKP